MEMWIRLGGGFAASLVIAGAAWKKGALSSSGGCSAVVLGALLALWGGWGSWTLMVLFFLIATVAGKAAKRGKAVGKDQHSGPRSAKQVWANGGPALAAAFLAWTFREPLWLGVTAASFAEATADTLASELGVLSRRSPLSLRTFRAVEAGESGAVSLLGLGVSLVGSLLIGGVDSLLHRRPLTVLVVVVLAGFLGALADSMLGATVQARYRCRECGTVVEKPVHHGVAAKPVSGWRWCGNSMVNFLSGLFAAVFATVLLFVF